MAIPKKIGQWSRDSFCKGHSLPRSLRRFFSPPYTETCRTAHCKSSHTFGSLYFIKEILPSIHHRCTHITFAARSCDRSTQYHLSKRPCSFHCPLLMSQCLCPIVFARDNRQIDQTSLTLEIGCLYVLSTQHKRTGGKTS